MYDKSQCAVTVNGRITEWFEVTVGVRQGCLLSPTLFNLFLDFMMDEVKSLQEHATLDERLNIDIRYADDTTLIAAVFDKLQLSTNQLIEACKKFGLKVNSSKCKVMTEEVTPITIDGEQVEAVDSFVFLGSVIPSTSDDVKRRVALANTAFGRLRKNIWTRKDIQTRLKLRLYKALILPIATYGSETWTLTKQITQNLTVFEKNCLRAILEIKLPDRVPIATLWKKAGIQNPIENTIKKQRLTWFGHVCRMNEDNVVQQMMKEDFVAKRKRGRPAKRWSDLIKEDTGLPIATANRMAKDRLRWRKNVIMKWAKPLSVVCR